MVWIIPSGNRCCGSGDEAAGFVVAAELPRSSEDPISIGDVTDDVGAVNFPFDEDVVVAMFRRKHAAHT